MARDKQPPGVYAMAFSLNQKSSKKEKSSEDPALYPEKVSNEQLWVLRVRCVCSPSVYV